MNMPSQDADKKVDRVRQEPRLPPGQVQTQKWPVLHYGSVPRIDLAKWSLRVDGLVEQPQHWTWAEFQALPRVQVYSDIHCVTRWSRFDNLWEGVALKEVLRRAQPKASGRFAVIHAAQGFTTNLPLTELDQDDVLLANKHDGAPLAPDHGWPLRLVVPRRYFWKSAKWVRGLEFMQGDRPGFWEQYGYHMRGDPWSEERYGWQ